MQNAERVPRISCPLVVIHGTADMVVPCSHGRQLHAMAQKASEPLWVKGAGHNDIPLDVILGHVGRFIASAVP